MSTIPDWQIVQEMKRSGGGFASALAVAFELADEENQRRIKETWPEYWFRYSAMLSRMAQEEPVKPTPLDFTKDEWRALL